MVKTKTIMVYMGKKLEIYLDGQLVELTTAKEGKRRFRSFGDQLEDLIAAKAHEMIMDENTCPECGKRY